MQDGDQQYSEQETVRRRDEWLRRSLNTLPKPHKDMVAERKAKRDTKDRPKRYRSARLLHRNRSGNQRRAEVQLDLVITCGRWPLLILDPHSAR